jgi:hypothetical protein
VRNSVKSDVPPIFLTYYMVKWQDVKQQDSEQKCQICGGPLKKTEELVDQKGLRYEGFVCHSDRQVTWVKVR